MRFSGATSRLSVCTAALTSTSLSFLVGNLAQPGSGGGGPFSGTSTLFSTGVSSVVSFTGLFPGSLGVQATKANAASVNMIFCRFFIIAPPEIQYSESTHKRRLFQTENSVFYSPSA